MKSLVVSSSKLLKSPLSKPGLPDPPIWYPAQAGRSRGIDLLESSQPASPSRCPGGAGRPPWDRLQPLGAASGQQGRRVGWRLEGLNGWDDGWGTADPGGREDSPADTVHDPEGDGGHGGTAQTLDSS